MIVWRLTSPRFARDPLSGQGAKLYGGRWNESGTAAVYAADSLALALLEWLVHVDIDTAPRTIVAHRLSWPDNLPFDEWRIEDLPENWEELPAPPKTQALGTGWLQQSGAVAVRVPSIVVKHEHCWVLNPVHKDFDKIEVPGSFTHIVDRRLIRC